MTKLLSEACSVIFKGEEVSKVNLGRCVVWSPCGIGFMSIGNTFTIGCGLDNYLSVEGGTLAKQSGDPSTVLITTRLEWDSE